MFVDIPVAVVLDVPINVPAPELVWNDVVVLNTEDVWNIVCVLNVVVVSYAVPTTVSNTVSVPKLLDIKYWVSVL